MIYQKFGKRLFDIFVSLLLLPIVLIIIILTSPIIYFGDKGTILYKGLRMGQFGRTFTMFKLRSMYMNAPDIRNDDGSTYNGVEDVRVTKFGRLLRKTSIDEIPQIINVLIGDMSIVGPRPNLATIPYHELDELQKKRLYVRPGITGYNQAFFRNSVDSETKFSNDVFYVDNMCFLMDIRILIRTLISVIRRENIYNQNLSGKQNG